MAKLNIGTKVTGNPNIPTPESTLSAAEANQIISVININADLINSSFDSTVVASGGTLPVHNTPAWLFVGVGTFTKPEGGTIVTTAPLNVIGTNGTVYSLISSVSVSLVDYYTKTQTDAAIAASSVLKETTIVYPKFGADGYIIADGRFVAASGWDVSDSAPIKEGDEISYKGTTAGNAQAIVLYSANKATVLVLLGTNSSNVTQKFTVPAGYDFARFSANTASAPAFSVKSKLIINNLISVGDVLKPMGAEQAIPTTIQTGGYINSAGTFIISASGWNYTEDTPVSKGDVLVYKGLASSASQAIVGYSADKSVVTTILGNNTLNDYRYYTVPAGVDIVRMSATVASAPYFGLLKYVLKKSALPTGVAESTNDLYPIYELSDFGDSITYLCDHPDTTYGPFNGGWIKVIKDKLGIKKHYNYGISGGKLADILATLITGQTVSKVNTVFIGTNDWTAATPLGDFTTDYLGNSNNGTFAANYRKFLDYLKTTNPGCFILLFTPMYRGAVSGTSKPESNVAVGGQFLSQFADMVISIARYEGLGVVDFFRNGPITHGNCDLRTGSNWVTYDGVHSNTVGNIGMAKLALPVIQSHIY